MLSVCPSVSTSDIVFFGENLPARFFSCIQSVSAPATTLPSAYVRGQPGSFPQLASGGRVVGSRGQWPSPGGGSWSPPGCSLFVGLPEGGPAYHHGHLPAGAALRVPHRQVSRGAGLGWGALEAEGARTGRHHPAHRSPRAPLSTPRLLINKEKTGQVSWLLYTAPRSSLPSHQRGPHPLPLASSVRGDRSLGNPVVQTSQLRTRDSRLQRGQVPGCPDS